jgi:hypothetical protein
MSPKEAMVSRVEPTNIANVNAALAITLQSVMMPQQVGDADHRSIRLSLRCSRCGRWSQHESFNERPIYTCDFIENLVRFCSSVRFCTFSAYPKI